MGTEPHRPPRPNRRRPGAVNTTPGGRSHAKRSEPIPNASRTAQCAVLRGNAGGSAPGNTDTTVDVRQVLTNRRSPARFTTVYVSLVRHELLCFTRRSGNPRQLPLHGVPGAGNGTSAGRSRPQPGAGTLTRDEPDPACRSTLPRSGRWPGRVADSPAFGPCVHAVQAAADAVTDLR